MNRHRFARTAGVSFALVLVAACASNEPATAPESTQSSAGTATTTATATTELAVSGGQVTTTTVTSAPPGAEDTQELVDALLLEPGSTYRVGGSFGSPGISFTFIAPDVDAYSYVVPGLVVISGDELGAVSLVSVLRRNGSRTYSVPSPDPSTIITAEDLIAITAPPPADPFEWMTSQGYVELGPIEETTFAGHPARITDYEFLEIDDGVACVPDDPRPCIWTFGSFDTAITYHPGELGTFIEVDLDGAPYLIDVRDQPGAAEIAASLEITIDEVVTPEAVADALDIPNAAPGSPPDPLEPGQAYRWASDDGRWYRFLPAETGETIAQDVRPPQGDPSAFASSPTDALFITSSFFDWFPGAFDEGPESVATFDDLIAHIESLEPGPLPPDLVSAMRSFPQLVVTDPDVRTVGDVEVAFVDITIAEGFSGGVPCEGAPEARCVYLLGLSLPISSNHTLRIGTITPRPGGQQWYLFAPNADVATTILDSVTIHDA